MDSPAWKEVFLMPQNSSPAFKGNENRTNVKATIEQCHLNLPLLFLFPNINWIYASLLLKILIPKINKLPIKAGTIKLITQMVKAAANIPIAFVLYKLTISMPAFQRIPRSVRKVKDGTTANNRNRMLIVCKHCPRLISTEKALNTK